MRAFLLQFRIDRQIKLRNVAKCHGGFFNIDPASGALLTPADVVTEVRRLPSLINKQLRAAGSLLELNVYRDHAADFSAEKADYAFALSAEGAVFVFNVNAFRSGITEPAEVLIRYSDDPFLIRPGFRIAGNE